jgi:hypothetical protein
VDKFKDKSIKDLVKNKRVSFSFYRAGELWYETSDGFLFPVPIKDIGDATFMKEDKAILFMRYIRKYREELEKS